MNEEEQVSNRVSFASPFVDEAEVERVEEAITSGWLTTGPTTAEFEDEVASRVGIEHAVGTTKTWAICEVGSR